MTSCASVLTAWLVGFPIGLGLWLALDARHDRRHSLGKCRHWRAYHKKWG